MARGVWATPESFWARVDIRSDEECWLWTRAQTRDPYGKPSYGVLGYQGNGWVAHRLAWTLSIGPIPTGLNVLHRCDNPPCCNTRHLFLGTHSDNMKDREAKGRRNPPPRVNGRWVKSTVC